MASFLTFHGLFSADNKLAKYYVDTPGDSHLEIVNLNPLVKLIHANRVAPQKSVKIFPTTLS